MKKVEKPKEIALCPVYNNPEKRFTPKACGYHYQGQKFEHFPENIPSINVYWIIWRTNEKDENGEIKWKSGQVPSCGFFVTDSFIKQRVNEGLWKIHKIKGVTVVLDVMTKKYPVIKLKEWKGYCNRCGICCLQPRVSTGKSCPYIQFVDEKGLSITQQKNFLGNKSPVFIKRGPTDTTNYSNKIDELTYVAKSLANNQEINVNEALKNTTGGIYSQQSFVNKQQMFVANKGFRGAKKMLNIKKQIEQHQRSHGISPKGE